MKQICLIGILLLVACSKPIDMGEFNQKQICKATISVVMGRSPNLMKINGEQDGIVRLSYLSDNRQKMWRYKCKLEGNRAIWGGDDSGRWRNEDNIRFAVINSELNVTENYSDNSSTVKVFTLADF